MADAAATLSVEAAHQVNKQANYFAYYGRNISHDANLFTEADQRIRNPWCSFRK